MCPASGHPTSSRSPGSSRQRTQSAVSSTARRGSSRRPSTTGSRTAASICRTELGPDLRLAGHPAQNCSGASAGQRAEGPRGGGAQRHQAGAGRAAVPSLRAPGSPLRLGLSACQCWLSGPGPQAVRPGPGWSLGHQPPCVAPAPRPTCPWARRPPFLSACPPACGRKLW